MNGKNFDVRITFRIDRETHDRLERFLAGIGKSRYEGKFIRSLIVSELDRMENKQAGGENGGGEGVSDDQ